MNTYVTYCFASAGVETSTIETSVHCCCAQRCVHDWRQRECGNRYAGQHTQSPRQLRYRGECLANIYILHNQIIDSERLQLHLPSLHMNDMLQQLVICDSWAAHECCDTLHVSHWKERKSNRSIVFKRLIITTRSTKYCCARLWLLTWSLSMKCWSCIVTLLRSLFVRFMIIPRRIKRYGISPQLMKVMTHGVNRRNHHHHRRRHHQNHHLGRRFKWIRSWDETQVLLKEGKQPSCKQPMDQQGILMTCPLTGRSHDAIRPTSCTTRRKDCPSDIKHINISLGFRLDLNMKNFWSGSIVGIQG